MFIYICNKPTSEMLILAILISKQAKQHFMLNWKVKLIMIHWLFNHGFIMYLHLIYSESINVGAILSLRHDI